MQDSIFLTEARDAHSIRCRMNRFIVPLGALAVALGCATDPALRAPEAASNPTATVSPNPTPHAWGVGLGETVAVGLEAASGARRAGSVAHPNATANAPRGTMNRFILHRMLWASLASVKKILSCIRQVDIGRRSYPTLLPMCA